ncbi:MAG: NAD(P)-dependent oxidoreductase [Planctomycetes bacterium]|nr:NAD(P)-dependent oxidoreductase [Planctomycetota bacterium]
MPVEAPRTERVAVTGAAGLLGRVVCDRLRETGNLARAADLAFERSVAGDLGRVAGNLLDPAHCRELCAGATTLIHAAAVQYPAGPPRWDRDRFFDANVAMTGNVTKAAVEAGVGHVVLISSDMVYGLPRGRPMRESDPPLPIGPYGRSKLACEGLVLALRERGLTATVLRPRLIVGAGRLGVLKRLFDRIRTHRAVPIIGNGSNRYQMIATSDVADACLRAVERRADGVFNLGSDDPPTVYQLLDELRLRAHSRSALARLPASVVVAGLGLLDLFRVAPLAPEQFRIAPVDYVLDTTAAKAALGWRPGLTDAEALWQAYRSYLASIGTPA